jgi:hypothetical protein
MTQRWIEMPLGSGPTGMGETPTFDGRAWWVSQTTPTGLRVLRCDGVGAHQTPDQIQYDHDWRARSWGLHPVPRTTTPHHPQHQTQNQVQYDRDWRSRAWGYSGPPAGFGDLASAQATVAPLIARIVAGCTRASLPEVSAFQAAYNTSGLPGQLTIDGQYGGNTQAAVQLVLNQVNGPPQAAPTNCFGMAVPATPALDPVAPAGPISPSTPTPPTSMNMGPIVIGGAALLGVGVVVYAWKRKKHKR